MQWAFPGLGSAGLVLVHSQSGGDIVADGVGGSVAVGSSNGGAHFSINSLWKAVTFSSKEVTQQTSFNT